MNKVSVKELKNIPYANADALGDRTFLLMPLWDGKEWHQWVQDGKGGLIKIQVVDLVRSNYVSKSAASNGDLFVPFIDFFWQRANWPEIFPFIITLCDDFHNLGTSLSKINHFFENRENIKKDSLAPFVNTELEYIVVVARTIFDIFQEAISKMWNGRIQLLDENAQAFKKGRTLPDTLSKIVLHEKTRVFGDNYKGAYRVNYNDTSRNIFSSTLVQSRINPSGARYARILDCTRLPEDLVEHEVYG